MGTKALKMQSLLFWCVVVMAASSALASLGPTSQPTDYPTQDSTSSPTSEPTSEPTAFASTCGAFKQAYQDNVCCQTQGGYEDKVTGHQVVPSKIYSLPTGDNQNRCAPITLSSVDPYFENVDCTNLTGAGLVYLSVEQAGANVSKGYYGDFDTSQPIAGTQGGTGRVPITTSFFDAGMCPVNVHWSLGTEHYSVGQYDQVRNDDNSPLNVDSDEDSGYFCHHYNETDTKFTKPYDWHFCKNMAVGETYEVKWPHSAGGACNTPDQYQTPFYDGLFCADVDLTMIESVGFQAQVFTVVNDEHYYYPDLIKGMIVEGNFGTEVTYYTGSTTGTSVNNSVCSREGPVTWQVDRTCHLISASSFDKMCADMLQQRDDMSADTQPHGSRELPTDDLVANNQQHDKAVQSTSGNPGRRSDGTQEHPTARRGDGYANSGFVYGGK